MIKKTGIVLGASLLASVASAPMVYAADLEPITPIVEEPEKGELIPGEFSGSVGVYTEYRFRGLDQTDNQAAVQGVVDYSVGTFIPGIDLYLGLFGSNINFTPEADDDGSVEIDLYGGLSGTLEGFFNWSVGFVYYAYPDADSSFEQDYVEATISIDRDLFDGFNVGLNYAVSPDFFGAGSGVGNWIQGTASYSIPGFDLIPLTLDASLGYQTVNAGGDFFGTSGDDYLTWHVGLTAELHKNVSLGVQYVDTDTSAFVTDADIAEAAAIGFVSFNF